MNESDILGRAERRFVGLPSVSAPRGMVGAHPCQGLYWTPKGESPRVAFIATHYNVDFSEHYIAPYLAARGFGFLGWNTRYRGAEDQFILEHALLDIGEGVRWLREGAQVDTVVILGNSGGGSLMGAYQAESHTPTLHESLSGAARERLQSLPAGDFFIALNAHQGRPEILTAWMDPAVLDEWDPVPTDPDLDMYRLENGPPYSPAFIARYRAAQRARNQRITDWAKAELKRLNEAGMPDRLFPLYRTWADLRFADGSIDPSERKVPGCYRGDPAATNRTTTGIGRANTLKTWLSMWSLETSKCQGAEHLAKITVPALVVLANADMGVFPSDGQALHAALGSTDKSFQMLPGNHYFEDSTDHRHRAADVLCEWLRKRI